MDEEPNLSTLLTQGEALPESNPAHEAELAKLRKEAEELARTKNSSWQYNTKLRSKNKKPKSLA
jgi:hypothetical protein